MNKPQPNFDLEFDSLVDRLRKAFADVRIQDFLQTNIRINNLFTAKLQHIIDNKDKYTHEYNFNVDDKILNKIDLFNNNIKLMIEKEESKSVKQRKDK